MATTSLLLTLVLIVITLFFTTTQAYLPGVPSKIYNRGSPVLVKTRKLSSVHNLPFDYYSLKFCKPKTVKNSAENLGEFLFGDRIENSVYNVCSA